MGEPPAVAVWGTSSGAGKSLVTTALARWYRRKGLAVVPFKAQNMSSFVQLVAGGEMATAQWLQALAAGVDPDVRMSPVVSKPLPSGDSQVVVRGLVDEALSRLPWRDRASRLWPVITSILAELRAAADLLLVEGAGSPAEINLADVDLANLATASHLRAKVLLVADINRGGAFAHLFGTWSLLADEHRDRIRGFILNGFRGDRALLGDAPAQLESLTGVPVVGVIPWLDHRLPQEDSLGPQRIEALSAAELEESFEQLADAVEAYLDTGALLRIAH